MAVKIKKAHNLPAVGLNKLKIFPHRIFTQDRSKVVECEAEGIEKRGGVLQVRRSDSRCPTTKSGGRFSSVLQAADQVQRRSSAEPLKLFCIVCVFQLDRFSRSIFVLDVHFYWNTWS